MFSLYIVSHVHLSYVCGHCGVYFQLRALEVGGANDILHMLFSAKGLDNKVIVFSLVCY